MKEIATKLKKSYFWSDSCHCEKCKAAKNMTANEEKRLIERGLDSDEVIEKRVSRAKYELKYVKFADYTVMNDNFADATKSLKSIIMNSKITPYIFC